MQLRRDITWLGVEYCCELAAITSEAGLAVCVGDALRLPLRSSSVDVVICVAVLHHLSTDARRLQAVSECFRVVRPGGHVLLQSWAFEQECGDTRRRFDAQDVFMPWVLQQKLLDATPAALLAANGVIESHRGVVVFNRFCHVFKRGELPSLCTRAGPCAVVEESSDKSNWCVIAQKL